jgi:opacity protein-like surface antigen
MVKKLQTANWLKSLAISVVLAGLLANGASADEFTRKNTGDIFGMVYSFNGDEVTSLGVRAKIDDTTLYGFGIGYALDDNFNLNTDVLFSSADFFKATSGDATSSSNSDLLIWEFNLDYYALAKPLTPMLTGGIGLAYLNGSGLGLDFNETDVTYNFGAGIRWDATKNIFVKALYRWTWLDADHTDNKFLFEGIAISCGILF